MSENLNSPLNESIPPEFTDVPMYRDGISSSLTYLIVAVRKGSVAGDSYNCICAGNGKVKFYPDPEFFGVQEEDLTSAGIDPFEKRSHHGYVRYFASREQVATLLNVVATKRGTIAVNPNLLLSAPITGASKQPYRPKRGHGGSGDKAFGFPGNPDHSGVEEGDDEEDQYPEDGDE